MVWLDVHPLMDVLGAIQTVDMDADDPQRDFIVETWMRISTCLGEDFVPYLRFVVPPLIQTASLVAQISVSEGSIVVPEEDEEQPGWDVVDVGDKVRHSPPSFTLFFCRTGSRASVQTRVSLSRKNELYDDHISNSSASECFDANLPA